VLPEKEHESIRGSSDPGSTIHFTRVNMMNTKKTGDETGKSIVEEVRKNREEREKTYRDRALRLFPNVCGRCGREFSGKRLRELTVHHRDHNHDNNPPDGSNWELLCIYCHDNEHSRIIESEWQGGSAGETDKGPSLTHNPFAGLGELLKKKK
jgi:hypothetical protein